MFDRIPRTTDSPLSGDVMDFQYYRVIPNQVLLGWSNEKEFDDIFSGMVIGWVHSPASLMAQCRWGQGRLLVTTMKLESALGDDPVASILMQNLISYLFSPQFQPRKVLEPASTRELGAGSRSSDRRASASRSSAEG
jgi:hypothetical protein